MKFCAIFLLIPLTLFAKEKGGAERALKIFPKSTVPGGVIAVHYALPAEDEPALYTLQVNGKDVAWDLCPGKKRRLCAFAAVEMDNSPKRMEAVVTKVAGGTPETHSVPVRPKKYPSGRLTVDPSKAVLSDEDKARMDEERARTKAVYEASEKRPLWDVDGFRLPGTAGTTSPFGVQRKFNGKVASTHYGLDLRGNEKTWILSSGAGRVVFADHLFLAGNFVAVDHGMGLFTTYSHLSEFAVKVGDEVKNGQRLGRAGATGRVTGPHLHWGVRINGLYVDPAQFLKIANR